MRQSSTFQAGDLVYVRTKDEILATLDERGQLDGLPFMPEMLAFCGQQFTVAKRAHKTCDPPNGLQGRRMLSAVHLDNVRCDGSAHGGCQARCLMFWKEAWIRKVGDADDAKPAEARHDEAGAAPRCTESGVWAGARDALRESPSSGPVYVCQSTQVPFATHPLAPWDLRQYIEDCTSGNVRPWEVLGAFLAFLCQQIANAGLGLGTPVRVAYDSVQRVRRGTPFPWRLGAVPADDKTPSSSLNLRSGELVKVRSYKEILGTINVEGNNRGMSFDAEMVPYCGGTYRVLARVDRIINEKSGVMQELKNACLILEDVVCLACYATHRRFCPRGIYPYWREVWLERVSTSGAADTGPRATGAPATLHRRLAERES